MKELTLKLGTLRPLEAPPGPAAFASALGEQGWYSITYDACHWWITPSMDGRDFRG